MRGGREGGREGGLQEGEREREGEGGWGRHQKQKSVHDVTQGGITNGSYGSLRDSVRSQGILRKICFCQIALFVCVKEVYFILSDS